MSLNDFCCHGWHLRSLVCLLDLVTRCRIGVICDWHDRLLSG